MLTVRGIDQLHERCVKAGATITSPLELKPWGMRMFTVQDPAGNKLDLGEAAR
jgi:uncharacterized glyoxalase superfamily protein PhnB